MLGFWEGEGREIEKREERQGSEGSAFWRKKKAGVVYIGFFLRFFFFFLVSEKFLFLFFIFKYYVEVKNCGSF